MSPKFSLIGSQTETSPGSKGLSELFTRAQFRTGTGNVSPHRDAEVFRTPLVLSYLSWTVPDATRGEGSLGHGGVG